MKKTMLLAAAALALVACGGNARRNGTATDNGRAEAGATLKSIAGTYTGTFPAADCPGIEMRLKLRDDGAYELRMKYIDREGTHDEKGRYEVRGDLLTLTSGTGDDSVVRYKIVEDRLQRLDADGLPIAGALAEHYVLTKKQ